MWLLALSNLTLRNKEHAFMFILTLLLVEVDLCLEAIWKVEAVEALLCLFCNVRTGRTVVTIQSAKTPCLSHYGCYLSLNNIIQQFSLNAVTGKRAKLELPKSCPNSTLVSRAREYSGYINIRKNLKFYLLNHTQQLDLFIFICGVGDFKPVSALCGCVLANIAMI